MATQFEPVGAAGETFEMIIQSTGQGSLFIPTLTWLPVGEAGGRCVKVRGGVNPLPFIDARVLSICLQT